MMRPARYLPLVAVVAILTVLAIAQLEGNYGAAILAGVVVVSAIGYLQRD